MAQMNFGGVVENVVTREEFPLEKAREVLKNESRSRGWVCQPALMAALQAMV